MRGNWSYYEMDEKSLDIITNTDPDELGEEIYEAFTGPFGNATKYIGKYLIDVLNNCEDAHERMLVNATVTAMCGVSLKTLAEELVTKGE